MNIKFSLNQSMLTDVTDLMTLIQENCGGKLRFSCTKCGRQYNRKDNLQRHVRFECGKEPQFKCPHCDHKTKQSGNMKTHIILKHPHQLNSAQH
ncbi:longitudinals lacking protein, isoforms N/O/W/X/Y-like [Homalodisca vitripennis]|uniref:longitudinals lacking protein, isoforms N/O/W/X/Y-like n=1 Tax=Homalodisca vitripennis TaxID=197043 RepID=UPI001EE9DE65|nr:longitudinals lacking protein, isoforms N/O/W/X/Y-like [Homalodisca vitripennis]